MKVDDWFEENDKLLGAACRVKGAPRGSVSDELRTKAEGIYTELVVELAELVEQEMEDEDAG